jgi:hypothetical protein
MCKIEVGFPIFIQTIYCTLSTANFVILLVGVPSHSGRVGEQKNLLPLSEIELPIPQQSSSQPSHHTD